MEEVEAGSVNEAAIRFATKQAQMKTRCALGSVVVQNASIPSAGLSNVLVFVTIDRGSEGLETIPYEFMITQQGEKISAIEKEVLLGHKVEVILEDWRCYNGRNIEQWCEARGFKTRQISTTSIIVEKAENTDNQSIIK